MSMWNSREYNSPSEATITPVEIVSQSGPSIEPR